MKRSTSSFPTKSSKPYQSIDQKVNMFALAAVVAVVTLLALAQRSEAKIVYTPANVVIGKSYKLDLKNDGVTDFTIQKTFSWSNQCTHNASLSELPASGNAVVPYNDIDGSFAAAYSRTLRLVAVNSLGTQKRWPSLMWARIARLLQKVHG